MYRLTFRALAFLSLFVLILLLVACSESISAPTPAPTFMRATPTATATFPPLPPSTPTPGPPTLMPAPAQPTVPPEPSASPVPLVVVRVVDQSDIPVAGATVRLDSATSGYSATYVTLEDGEARFTGFDLAAPGYQLTTSMPGFLVEEQPLVIDVPLTEVTVSLEAGVRATTTVVANLRAEPYFGAEILIDLPAGTPLLVNRMQASGAWMDVTTPDGLRGWVFTELLAVEGDLSLVERTTPVPTLPVPPTTTATLPTPPLPAASPTATSTP